MSTTNSKYLSNLHYGALNIHVNKKHNLCIGYSFQSLHSKDAETQLDARARFHYLGFCKIYHLSY